jgi:hypothetical protein
MLRKATMGAVLALGLSMASGAAGAATVDLSSLVNSDIRTYTNGSVYPIAPTTLTINGIGFSLIPDGAAPNSLGVIQTPAGDSSFTIPVSLPGVTTVYTLINSAFGANADLTGSLVFTDAANDTFTYDLTEGVNVRDHFNGAFINTASNLFGTATFTGAGGTDRLDAQQIFLPSAFASSTLTQIVFHGINAGSPQGEPFLAAITTSTVAVPEPGTWALLLVGVGAMGAGLRTRRGPRLAAA